MTTLPTFNRHSTRILFVTLAMALASTIGSSAGVSADVLVPAVSTGGSGGGSGYGGHIDETARAQNLNALTSGEEVVHHPTQNERSIQMIESTLAPGGLLAGAPAAPSRIPYEESEHAVAQNRFATGGEVAEQAQSPSGGAHAY